MWSFVYPYCYFGWNLAWPSTDTQQIHYLNRKNTARRTRWGKATRPSLKQGKTEKEGGRQQVVLEKSRSSVIYSISVFCSYFQVITPHIYTNVFKTTQKSSLPSFQSEGKKIGNLLSHLSWDLVFANHFEVTRYLQLTQ